MKKRAYLIISLLFTLFSCKENKVNNIYDDNNQLQIIIEKLISEWSDADSSKDLVFLSTLYDESVLFYGTQMKRDDCIKNKQILFKKNPNFNQIIYGSIKIEYVSTDTVKCIFLKRVSIDNVTKDYPSYLLLTKVNDSWKISVEGDSITDKNLSKIKYNIPDEAKIGDYNGDGKTEYVWLVPPKFPKENDENYSIDSCIGMCNCVLEFSDKSIPPVPVSNCIGGIPNNEGDLNNDNADEVGILPDWWTSCWIEYQVFTYENSKWSYVIEPFSTHCNQWDSGIDAIQKDKYRDGYVIINYSMFTEDSIVTLSKSIPILN